ncbi:hypothetical protein J1614_000909 [Plenodomus biglobosus]|nr:hypothetical protein J1614_000909 [Plenodomus biglobosus]
MTIRRMGLFKIAKEEDQQKLVGLFKAMQSKALKNGQPYIVSVEAGQTQQDARAQGYTVAATAVFANEEDMRFYDEECTTHTAMKEAAKGFVEDAIVVYFTV